MKLVRLDLSRLLGFKIIGASNSGIGSAKIGVKPDLSDTFEIGRVSMAAGKSHARAV